MPAVISVEMTLEGKRRRRFYEPIVLLKALTRTHESRTVPDNDRTNLLTQSDEDVFHVFVYKLALACSREKGGNTVTSIAVMEDPTAFTYLVACNDVTSEDGESIADHIKALLHSVDEIWQGSGKTTHESRDDILKKILLSHKKDIEDCLKKILLFNRKRIEPYLKNIVSCATDSLAKMPYNDAQRSEVSDCLKGLASCASVSELSEVPEADYLGSCFACLASISEMMKFRVSTQTREEEITKYTGTEIWAELKHSISRMRAYPMIVEAMIKARRRWPELFKDPKVIHIPSSTPLPKPLSKRSESAEVIIGRMTSDQDEMDVFRDYAQDMRKFDLDARISKECGKPDFRPVIHSEILVHEWIAREGHNHNLRFFNDWQYIGCSKPTCLLCKYYFESCGSEVQTRPSHGNLYVAWQFPSSAGPSKSSAGKKWQNTLNNMQLKIRQAAFKVMKEKSSPGKDHDSNTYTLGLVGSTRYSQSLRHTQKNESVIAEDVSVLGEDGGSDSDVEALGDQFGEGLTLTDDEDGGALISTSS